MVGSEAVFIESEEKVSQRIGEIQLRPYLNKYSEVEYEVKLVIYTDDYGFIPETVRGDSNILDAVFSATWGWHEYDSEVERECRVRSKTFKSKEEAEQAIKEIIETLRKNYKRYLENKKQIEREKKTIHIYL